jgi:hypothetical protein
MRVFGTLLSLAIVGMLVGCSAQERKATAEQKPAGAGGAREKAKLPKGPAPRQGQRLLTPSPRQGLKQKLIVPAA